MPDRPHCALLWLMVGGVASLVSQRSAYSPGHTSAVCFHAEPNPACAAFFVTNAGVSVIFRGSNAAEPSVGPRVLMMDWGFMGNSGERDAFGGSIFAHWDDDGFAAGPAVRYRRWLPHGAMLDFSLGTPVVKSSDGNVESGSIFGLVKWSPTHWFGLALRPEMIRRSVFNCPTATCTVETQSRAQVSLGVEFGWWPGLVAGATSFVLAGIARSDAGQ